MTNNLVFQIKLKLYNWVHQISIMEPICEDVYDTNKLKIKTKVDMVIEKLEEIIFFFLKIIKMWTVRAYMS